MDNRFWNKFDRYSMGLLSDLLRFWLYAFWYVFRFGTILGLTFLGFAVHWIIGLLALYMSWRIFKAYHRLFAEMMDHLDRGLMSKVDDGEIRLYR